MNLTRIMSIGSGQRAVAGSAEHRNLQARAFGRNATADDGRALVAYERAMAQSASGPATEADPLVERVPEPTSTEDRPIAEHHSPARRPARTYLIAAGALLLAVAAGWGIHWLLAPTPPAPSLDVFSRPATEDDQAQIFTLAFASFDTPGSILVTDSRMLTELDGRTFYAGWGVTNIAQAGATPEWDTAICLAAEQAGGLNGGGAACASLDDFLANGLYMDMGDGHYYQWGPTGQVTLAGLRSPTP